MDEGGSHPCLGLGETDHGLLRWAKKNTGRKGLVRMCGSRLEYWSGREVIGAGPANWDCLEDNGYVEKVSIEGTYTYRVLVVCVCQGGLYQTPDAPGVREPKLSRSDELGEPVRVSAVPALSRGMDRSAQKSVGVTTLAHQYFPEIVRGAGIPMNMEQTNGAGLVRVLRSWKAQGIGVETMRLMMEEFARHPDWCQRSRRNPWQVFASHREELAGLLAHRKRKDPSNRRWSADKDYFRRHTSLVNSPA